MPQQLSKSYNLASPQAGEKAPDTRKGEAQVPRVQQRALTKQMALYRQPITRLK